MSHRAKVKHLRPDQIPDLGGLFLTDSYIEQGANPALPDTLTLEFEDEVMLGPGADPTKPGYSGPDVASAGSPTAVHLIQGSVDPAVPWKVVYDFPNASMGGTAQVVQMQFRSGWLRSKSGGFIARANVLVKFQA